MIYKEIPNFISKEKCSNIINILDKDNLIESGLATTKNLYRTSKGKWVDENITEVKKIKEKINNILWKPLNIKKTEAPYFIKYEKGEYYKIHYDFFNIKNPTSKRQVMQYGQRFHSAMLYLNDNFNGGETIFSQVEPSIKIIAEAGKLIIFNNLHKNLTPCKESAHESLPIKSGTKYVLIFWDRVNIFGESNEIFFNQNY